MSCYHPNHNQKKRTKQSKKFCLSKTTTCPNWNSKGLNQLIMLHVNLHNTKWIRFCSKWRTTQDNQVAAWQHLQISARWWVLQLPEIDKKKLFYEGPYSQNVNKFQAADEPIILLICSKCSKWQKNIMNSAFYSSKWMKKSLIFY